MTDHAMTDHTLTRDEKDFLRDLAHEAVAAAAAGRAAPDPMALAESRGLTPGPALLEHRGAFVTLTRGGNLRGCIGYIEGIKPLIEAVADNAASAAVRDPRFPPVTPDEVPDLELEVSALSPLRAVPGPEDIVIGRHGILLEKNGRRAVFLPQVAVEQGWDLETTLGHLCLKAGLPPHAWQEGARFQVFTAEVF